MLSASFSQPPEQSSRVRSLIRISVLWYGRQAPSKFTLTGAMRQRPLSVEKHAAPWWSLSKPPVPPFSPPSRRRRLLQQSYQWLVSTCQYVKRRWACPTGQMEGARVGGGVVGDAVDGAGVGGAVGETVGTLVGDGVTGAPVASGTSVRHTYRFLRLVPWYCP